MSETGKPHVTIYSAVWVAHSAFPDALYSSANCLMCSVEKGQPSYYAYKTMSSAAHKFMVRINWHGCFSFCPDMTELLLSELFAFNKRYFN